MPPRTLAAGVLSLLLSGCGLTGNFRHDPGYAAFGSPGALATDRELALSLGPLPLGLARLFVDDDPELGVLLQELRAVRVYTYDVADDADGVEQRVEAMRSRLLNDGWRALITVREGTELTSVLLRPDSAAGRNRGLAVIVQDPSEVVLVNLIGNVRLDLFDDYMAEIEVDAPLIAIDPSTLQARAR